MDPSLSVAAPSVSLASADLQKLLRRQQQAFLGDMSPARAAREDRLRRLDHLIETHAEAFAASISQDFGTRSPVEIRITETMLVRSGIRHALKHLATWMKPRRVGTALAYRPGRSMLAPQPLGVVGIISPWNYPLQLALAPLIGALAACKAAENSGVNSDGLSIARLPAANAPISGASASCSG